MTAVLPRPTTGEATGMPGWTIVANLTPPELVDARRLGSLRRRIVLGLVVVLLACGGAYAYAFSQHGSAADAASAVSQQTADLQRATSKYAGITRIETTVAGVRQQVSTVMHDDVDIPHALRAIRSALPGSMSIDNLTLTITATGTQSATSLDASGHTEIGMVTITGSGRTLDDLPAFVDRLSKIHGLVDVLPTSNLVNAGKAQFTVICGLSDALYSHRYDVTGGK